jgi:hypothetical protein
MFYTLGRGCKFLGNWYKIPGRNQPTSFQGASFLSTHWIIIFDTELLISFRIEHANESEKHGKQAERAPLIRSQRKIE